MPRKKKALEDEAPEEVIIEPKDVQLVFSEDVVTLWLSKSHARLVNAVDSVMLEEEALPQGHMVALLVWALAALRPGGVILVPEVFLGSEYLEPLAYLGPSRSFFAFRKEIQL